MDTIHLTIDGLNISAKKGKSILEAALENNIYIPHLCYSPDLKPYGACRLCMVEVEGRGMVVSCVTPAEEGLKVQTESPRVSKVRRNSAELLIINHHGECLSCHKDTHCELQKVASFVGIDEKRLARLRKPPKMFELDTSNPFFDRDMNKCILCGICVRACDEVQGAQAIDFANRGFSTTISTFGDKPLKDSVCESCGECLVRCPTGALVERKSLQSTREVKTICPYCGCGCSYYLGVRGSTIVHARGDRESPVNRGALCVKGRFGFDFVNHADRLTTPLIKREGKLVEATWDEALDLIAKKLPSCKGDKFAFVASAKCTNEDNYVMQKFARLVMGTNNIDHCARLCHAPSVAGLAQSLGSGAMTNSIAEIEHARVIFAIGTNTTAAHPIIGLRIKEAVRNGAKLIVVNPREIDLCRLAHIWLRQSPGTDVPLMMGMMKIILEENWHDQAFIENRCENFEAFKSALKALDLNLVERITGVKIADLKTAAQLYATQKPASILYSMGITQHSHGTDNVIATSNLALLTGNVGKPSSGVNPLRGQNNVQGACDMGALPVVYPGYQKVDNPTVKEKFETAWGGSLSASPGLTLTELVDSAGKGKIKCMYLVGENPIISEADSKHVEAALKELDLFIVQDIFLTETARLAHVVLPATTFAEKDGTFTNTERRVQRVRKAIEPIGSSRPDWKIICDVAKNMGNKGFDFNSPSEIMGEIASLTPSYGGVTFERLDKEPGVTWPCPTKDHPGTPILHAERFATPSQKGKFVPLEYKPPIELPDAEYPILLTTERSLYHFHTGSMTRKVKGLNVLRETELVEMSPIDAAYFDIRDGELVHVISRRGELKANVKVTESSPPGVISMTFHFSETPTNVLTICALDPVAKIPETKVCAVRIEKINND